MGLPVPSTVCPPRAASVVSVATTRYPVVGLPPAAPGVNATCALASPGVTAVIVGAPGGVPDEMVRWKTAGASPTYVACTVTAPDVDPAKTNGASTVPSAWVGAV